MSPVCLTQHREEKGRQWGCSSTSTSTSTSTRTSTSTSTSRDREGAGMTSRHCELFCGLCVGVLSIDCFVSRETANGNVHVRCSMWASRGRESAGGGEGGHGCFFEPRRALAAGFAARSSGFPARDLSGSVPGNNPEAMGVTCRCDGLTRSREVAKSRRETHKFGVRCPVSGVRCSAGEPRTGVRGCCGWPIVSRDAATVGLFSVARAFQPEICPVVAVQLGKLCRLFGSREAAMGNIVQCLQLVLDWCRGFCRAIKMRPW